MRKYENKRTKKKLGIIKSLEIIVLIILIISFAVLAYCVSLCVYQIGTLITAATFGVGTVAAFIIIIVFLYLFFRPYKEGKSLSMNMKTSVS